MKASDKLLNLRFRSLKVFRIMNGNIAVKLQGAWVEEGAVLRAEVGRGASFEEACDEYLKCIEGKKLVFDPHTKNRKEIFFPSKEAPSCHTCEHCVYIGEGGHMCDLTNSIVLDDWEPTDDFLECRGEDYI